MLKILNRVPKVITKPLRIRHSKTFDEDVVISMDGRYPNVYSNENGQTHHAEPRIYIGEPRSPSELPEPETIEPDLEDEIDMPEGVEPRSLIPQKSPHGFMPNVQPPNPVGSDKIMNEGRYQDLEAVGKLIEGSDAQPRNLNNYEDNNDVEEPRMLLPRGAHGGPQPIS